MDQAVLLSYAGALLTVVASAIVLWRGPRLFVHWVLSIGLALFAVEALFIGLAYQATSPADVAHLCRTGLALSAFLPGVWIVFSFGFGRIDYRRILTRWQWVIGGAILLPPLTAMYFGEDLFDSFQVTSPTSIVKAHLGWSGSFLYLLHLTGWVIVLMNLERILRSSAGIVRWQMKFLVVALAGLFIVRVFTDSQALLFRVLDLRIQEVSVTALILADLAIVWSLVRARHFDFDLYLSDVFLYNSFTALLTGTYLIAVALLGYVAHYLFDQTQVVSIVAFLLLPALTVLAVLLLSDGLRSWRKRFIISHLRRPRHDYRIVWAAFTAKTTPLSTIPQLSATIVKFVSETLEAPSVSIWLLDEKQERLTLGASTVFRASQAQRLAVSGTDMTELLSELAARSLPVDLEVERNWIDRMTGTYGDTLREARARCCAILQSSGRLVGLLTLDGRAGQEAPFDAEDFQLLKTIADQAAATLLRAQLVEGVRQAKELEAFQVMSAFFIHDLKNLASKLSLVTQNMPAHFDDHEFREDALKTISHSVAKMGGMCSRLSLLSRKLDLHMRSVNIGEVISQVLSEMGEIRAGMTTRLNVTKPILLDEEQMRKVFTNLLLNAIEAVSADGHIEITSDPRGAGIEVAVTDNGCGMSREFIDKSLFRPFQTTKKQGMGIGLFHSKTIVEAHGGRIEVESVEGKGSTFKVVLPVTKGQKEPQDRKDGRAEGA
jgi:putative PEP-CTERM system histidine kinase